MFGKRVVAGAIVLFLAAIACAAQGTQAPAQPPANAASQGSDAQLIKKTEAFVRNLFAWGPDVKMKIGTLTQSPAAGFYTVPIDVTLHGHTESGDVYVSKDGKTLLRGEIFDMSVDPFAANRAKLEGTVGPSKGPADAAVTLVEFADFECPHCGALYDALKIIEQHYPQIRIVYKDFPLTAIHPWAEKAAIAGQCAYEESPAAFWKVHDAIFENQAVITTDNVSAKLAGFAAQAGLNADTFKACLASPKPRQVIAAEQAEGAALGVDGTPTVFINGRPLVGDNIQELEQYIDYALAKQSK